MTIEVTIASAKVLNRRRLVLRGMSEITGRPETECDDYIKRWYKRNFDGCIKHYLSKENISEDFISFATEWEAWGGVLAKLMEDEAKKHLADEHPWPFGSFPEPWKEGETECVAYTQYRQAYLARSREPETAKAKTTQPTPTRTNDGKRPEPVAQADNSNSQLKAEEHDVRLEEVITAVCRQVSKNEEAEMSRGQLSATAEEIRRLRQQLAESIEDTDASRQRLAQAENEAVILRQQLEQLQAEFGHLQQRVPRLEADAEALRQQLEETHNDEQLQQLQTEVDHLQKLVTQERRICLYHEEVKKATTKIAQDKLSDWHWRYNQMISGLYLDDSLEPDPPIKTPDNELSSWEAQMSERCRLLFAIKNVHLGPEVDTIELGTLLFGICTRQDGPAWVEEFFDKDTPAEWYCLRTVYVSNAGLGYRPQRCMCKPGQCIQARRYDSQTKAIMVQQN
ncbi:hypothetical protein F4680DRAFT_469710 [Xylaria scruposa]|nr:hypothetical protein F4680DRAFT_469710 [Xylaria scruposa]